MIPRKLAQEPILGRAGSPGLLGEDHLDPGSLELFEQQHLIGVAAQEPIGRMTQQYVEAALDRQATRKRSSPGRRSTVPETPSSSNTR
jgi:hypothetical protein